MTGENRVFVMRSGGFGAFPKGRVSGPEAYLGPPPPEKEQELVGAWVSGEPWNVTGFSVGFAPGAGLTDQEMMDLEISYADHPETVRRDMEFPDLPPDPEAAAAFKALTPLLKPGPQDVPTPPVEDLVRGFSASLGEVIRAYAPKHAVAIGQGGGQFVPGPKLGPALKAFASLLARTSALNGDEPDLPASEGNGAFFIAPHRAVNLATLFDRAAFRSLMMGETVPRALTVALFEARHALDERLSGERLPAQESWDAMMEDAATFVLSPDRELVGRMGAEIAAARKPVRAAPASQEPAGPAAPVPDLWAGEDADYDDSDPASFGL